MSKNRPRLLLPEICKLKNLFCIIVKSKVKVEINGSEQMSRHIQKLTILYLHFLDLF